MAEHAEHPPRNYVKTWAILVMLLVISVAGPTLGVHIVTVITAFGVALVKAYVVAKEFMHLDVERRVVHYVLVTSLAFIVLLFAGTAPDVMEHEGQHWENHAAKESSAAATEAGGEHGPR